MSDKPRDPLRYEPQFTFDPDIQSYKMEAPSRQQIAADMVLAFVRDIDGKIRQALIEMGWKPPGEDEELNRLRKQADTDRLIIALLRSQLRVLGHIPTVVESEDIGRQELEMRMKARGN